MLLSGQMYTVDQTTDTGAGSGTSGDLRYCITQANSNQGSTIQFSVTGAIALSTALPDVAANLTINGPGASNLTVQGTNLTRVVAVDSVTVTISDLTIAGGTVSGGGEGGGILNNHGTLTVNDCAFSGNAANTGGAIDNDLGWLTVNNSTFVGNTAYAFGGALQNDGQMTLSNCTLSNNYANDGGGGISNRFNLTVSGCTFNNDSVGGIGRGGAIDNFFATATITNSTFVNNSAVLGGALDNYYASGTSGSHAIANLTDVTMTGSSGGGIDNEGDTSGYLTLINSVIAGNSGGDVIGVVNPFNSTYNLIGDGSQMAGIGNGSNGNQVGTSSNPINAKLGTLSNNGGPTQTVALLAGSPALDAGSGAATSDTDQRGVPRGQVLDLGAYQATASQLIVAGFASPTTPGVSHAFTVSAVDSFGQSSLDFNSPVSFASSDSSATLPTGQSLAAGQGTFNATLNTPGVQSITATAGSLSGSQTGINVSSPTATASFVGQDVARRGNWIGTYGANGYDALGYTASLPSYATVTPANNTYYTWAASTNDTRALQNPANPTGSRVSACWYSTHNTASFTVDVHLTDSQSHDLALYLLDWPNSGRAETVQLSDATSGTVLDTQSVSSFGQGVYLQWTISGNVLITITKTAGASAVLSGLFFDPPPAPPPQATASFVGENAPARNAGNWIGTYGADGYNALGYTASLPGYATVTSANNTYYTWAASTNDTRALQNPANPTGSRVSACWYSTHNTASFTVDVNLTDGQSHDLALYLLDWPNSGRAETVQLSDATSGTVLDTQSVSSFSKGVYLQWTISGNVLITITKTAGSSAVLSGLFFDPSGTSRPSSAAVTINRPLATKPGTRAATDGVRESSSTPMMASTAIARGSSGGPALVPAAGPVDAVLGALPDDDDATTAALSIHDLAMEQVLEPRTTGRPSHRGRA